tara:strand:+ start:53 stop:1249 length:1197 start_codon:yes stop_codon:yes gene_type:complete
MDFNKFRRLPAYKQGMLADQFDMSRTVNSDGSLLRDREGERMAQEQFMLDVIGTATPFGVLRKVDKIAKVVANNPYLKGVKEGDELIGIHNLSADNLEHAHELGGLPVPSIAITKANAPLEGFGDISLIANQKMVAPSRGNPVFGADAYSRRYPTIEYHNDVDKIFKGFTRGGKRRYAPHTLENVVKEMKGAVPNSEGFSYGAGSLRSEYAPKFRSLRGIQKARDQVVSEKEMIGVKDEMNERLLELVDDLLPYDKHYSKYELGYGDTVSARLGPKERLSDYYDDIPPDLLKKINQYKADLITSPTAYFEAKPQRGVRLDEFSGAVVPHNVDPRALDILHRRGIADVEHWGGISENTGRYKTKAEALKNFKKYMFGVGGTAVALPVLSEREVEQARNK